MSSTQVELHETEAHSRKGITTEEILVEKLDKFLNSIELRLNNFDSFFENGKNKVDYSVSITEFSLNHLNSTYERLLLIKKMVLKSSFINLDLLYNNLLKHYEFLYDNDFDYDNLDDDVKNLNENENENENESQVQSDPMTLNQELPYLVSHVLPSFFKSYQLNPISKNAQKNIAVPEDLNLDEAINPTPQLLPDEMEFNDNYQLYLSDNDDTFVENEPLLALSDNEKKKSDRLERLRDDPYYITSSGKKLKSKKKHIEKTSSPEVSSEQASILSETPDDNYRKKVKSKKLKKEKVVILSEETIGKDDTDTSEQKKSPPSEQKKKNKLKIDSSNLDNFELSSTMSENVSSDNKEYDIDLEVLRKKLAEDAPKKKKKSIKKPIKSKKIQGQPESSELEPKTEDVENLEPKPKTNESSDLADKIITVKKTKKTKKKKAAIIE